MHEVRTMTCVVCPKSCRIKVTVDTERREIISVEHAQCRRGVDWATEELTHPVRTLCSSIRVLHGSEPVTSIKTSRPVPREKMDELMELIRTITVEAPVSMGRVVCSKPLGLSCDLIVTRSVERESVQKPPARV
jgi:CxxC motif-containing protein